MKCIGVTQIPQRSKSTPQYAVKIYQARARKDGVFTWRAGDILRIVTDNNFRRAREKAEQIGREIASNLDIPFRDIRHGDRVHLQIVETA